MVDKDTTNSSPLQSSVNNPPTSRIIEVSLDMPPSSQGIGVSKYFDDDGRPKRTGTVWTTSAHIITAVIGSGVLSLAWAIAQMGWIAGPIVMLLFAVVTYYTSILLSACYRTEDGKRNYTYMDAASANFSGFQVKVCGAL
ncbi:OLC1v1013789C1 [Oldenlandia corymbosa var. corymbosa]|uniref:OLC1v1013789C1 n=1 Tax=Oldenlandia corymbosa var. corymbosa TaxID=529605 RepID=A0AAV1E2K1_OLDCO|nr:OLC1v1013789C1 [Oldenlandia corymbosa var. corymbosa]